MYKMKMTAIVAALLLCGLSSCGGGGSAPVTPPTPPQVTLNQPVILAWVQRALSDVRMATVLPASQATLKVISPYSVVVELTFEASWRPTDQSKPAKVFSIAGKTVSPGETPLTVALPAADCDDIKVTVVATAHYKGQDSPPSTPAVARYWRPPTAAPLLDPITAEFTSVLQLRLPAGTSGEVIVSDSAGNHITKSLDASGLTVVDIAALTSGEVKVEVRVDGYLPYIERLAYEPVPNEGCVLLVEPTELQAKTTSDTPSPSYDLLESGDSVTWLATLGESGAKLSVDVPTGCTAGVIADDQAVLVSLYYKGHAASVSLDATKHASTSAVGSLATLTQMDQLDYHLSIVKDVEALFGGGPWDPFIESTVAGTNGNPFAGALLEAEGTKLAFPGTYSYYEASEKLLSELRQKTEKMILLVVSGGIAGVPAGGIGVLPGIAGGGILASLSGNAVGVSDLLSAFFNKGGEQVAQNQPADQRYVVLTNPALNLTLTVIGGKVAVLLGRVWAILPVEPRKLDLYAGDSGPTSVSVGETETLHWHLDFGGEAGWLTDWRAESLTVWTDSSTIATVTGKSKDQGIRVTGHAAGTTTLRAKYQSPAPFNDRAPLEAVFPITVAGPPGVAPAISSIAPISGTAGAQLQPVATVSGTAPLSFAWNFGGGASPNTSSATAPSVTLGAQGSYSASLAVSNPYGTATYPFTLVVNTAGTAPTISGVSPTSGTAGTSVQFSASVSGTAPFTYSWVFGGGASPNTSTAAQPSVTLGNAGTYSASVTVTNVYGSKTYGWTLTVSSAPQQKASVNIVLSRYPGEIFEDGVSIGFPQATNGDGYDQLFMLTVQRPVGSTHTYTFRDYYPDVKAPSSHTLTVSAGGVLFRKHYSCYVNNSIHLTKTTWETYEGLRNIVGWFDSYPRWTSAITGYIRDPDGMEHGIFDPWYTVYWADDPDNLVAARIPLGSSTNRAHIFTKSGNYTMILWDTNHSYARGSISFYWNGTF